jgi:uncharacterized protein YoxC
MDLYKKFGLGGSSKKDTIKSSKRDQEIKESAPTTAFSRSTAATYPPPPSEDKTTYIKRSRRTSTPDPPVDRTGATTSSQKKSSLPQTSSTTTTSASGPRSTARQPDRSKTKRRDMVSPNPDPGERENSVSQGRYPNPSSIGEPKSNQNQSDKAQKDMVDGERETMLQRNDSNQPADNLERCESPVSLQSSVTQSKPLINSPPPPMLASTERTDSSFDSQGSSSSRRLRNASNQNLKNGVERGRELEDPQKTIQGLRDELNKLKGRTIDQDNKIEELKSDIQTRNSSIRLLETEVQELEIDGQKKDSSYQTLQWEFTTVKLKNETLQKRSDAQQSRIQYFENLLATESSKGSKRTKDLEFRIQQADMEKTGLLEERKSMKIELEDMKSQLSSVRTENELLHKELEGLKEDYEEDIESWNNFCISHHDGASFSDLKRSYQLEENLAAARKELEDFRAQHEDMEAKVTSYRSELEGTNARHTKELDVLKVSHQVELESIEAHHEEKTETLSKHHLTSLNSIKAQHKAEMDEIQAVHSNEVTAWKTQLARWQSRHKDMVERFHLHLSVMFDELKTSIDEPNENQHDDAEDSDPSEYSFGENDQ